MPTDVPVATYHGFDFDLSYPSARKKALEIALAEQHRIVHGVYTEWDFKSSFKEIFADYLDYQAINSVSEQIIINQALEVMLVNSLSRFFQYNAIITESDLNTFLTIVEWFRELIETIMNP